MSTLEISQLLGNLVLVCFYILGIIGGMFAINDHEVMMESVRDLMR